MFTFIPAPQLDSSLLHLIPSLPCLASINSPYYAPPYHAKCLLKSLFNQFQLWIFLNQQKVRRLWLKSAAFRNKRRSAQQQDRIFRCKTNIFECVCAKMNCDGRKTGDYSGSRALIQVDVTQDTPDTCQAQDYDPGHNPTEFPKASHFLPHHGVYRRN